MTSNITMKAQYFLYVFLLSSLSCIGINAQEFERKLEIALKSSMIGGCLSSPEMNAAIRKADECIGKKTSSDLHSMVESYCQGKIEDCITIFRKSTYKCVKDDTKDSVTQFEKALLGGIKAVCELGDDSKDYLEKIQTNCIFYSSDTEECEAIVADLQFSNVNDIFTEANCEKYHLYKECLVKVMNGKCSDAAPITETILDSILKASPCM